MLICMKHIQWCTKVGAEQRLLPAIYLQDYCNSETEIADDSTPTKFPRSLKILNYATGTMQNVWIGDANGSFLGSQLNRGKR